MGDQLLEAVVLRDLAIAAIRNINSDEEKSSLWEENTKVAKVIAERTGNKYLTDLLTTYPGQAASTSHDEPQRENEQHEESKPAEERSVSVEEPSEEPSVSVEEVPAQAEDTAAPSTHEEAPQPEHLADTSRDEQPDTSAEQSTPEEEPVAEESKKEEAVVIEDVTEEEEETARD